MAAEGGLKWHSNIVHFSESNQRKILEITGSFNQGVDHNSDFFQIFSTITRFLNEFWNDRS